MSATIELTATVLAELNYLVPTRERPRTFTYEPTDGSPRSTIKPEPHRLPIRDIREEDRAFTLDDEGFAVVQHHLPSATSRMRPRSVKPITRKPTGC